MKEILPKLKSEKTHPTWQLKQQVAILASYRDQVKQQSYSDYASVPILLASMVAEYKLELRGLFKCSSFETRQFMRDINDNRINSLSGLDTYLREHNLGRRGWRLVKNSGIFTDREFDAMKQGITLATSTDKTPPAPTGATSSTQTNGYPSVPVVS